MNLIKKNLQERLAKIAGGVAVIGVGAATEVEMKDKKIKNRRCTYLQQKQQ